MRVHEQQRSSAATTRQSEILTSLRCDSGPAESPQNVGSWERILSGMGGSLLVGTGLRRGGLTGTLAAGLGGGLLYRAVTGHCGLYEALGWSSCPRPAATAVPAQSGVSLHRTLLVNRTPEELFAFWRDPQNLYRVLQHVDSVVPLDSKRWKWTAPGRLGGTMTWETEIFNEREPELIAWRSLPGGDVETAGSLRIEALPGGRGTKFAISLKYNPPGGKLVEGIASFFGKGLDDQIEQDLRTFKQLAETGEIASVSGQPCGAGRCCNE